MIDDTQKWLCPFSSVLTQLAIIVQLVRWPPSIVTWHWYVSYQSLTSVCFPTVSKMVGWQLCSNASYPSPATGFSLPAPGRVHLSLRLLKLDRGLHYYLLEAAYSLLPAVRRSSDQFHLWEDFFLREISSSTLTVTNAQRWSNLGVSEGQLAPRRGLHPPPPGHTPVLHSQGHVCGPHLQPSQTVVEDHPSAENHPNTGLVTHEHHNKNPSVWGIFSCCVVFTGQLEQERNIKSGKLELWIDGSHYYVMVGIVIYYIRIKLQERFDLKMIFLVLSSGFGWHSDAPVRAENAFSSWSQSGRWWTSHDPLC